MKRRSTPSCRSRAALAKTQNQLSTGKSINSPADNPVGAVQVLQLDNSNAQYQQYVGNGQSANSRPDAARSRHCPIRPTRCSRSAI